MGVAAVAVGGAAAAGGPGRLRQLKEATTAAAASAAGGVGGTLSEIAGSAASWSVDRLLPLGDRVFDGGRKDVDPQRAEREVAARAEGVLLRPPPFEYAAACAACSAVGEDAHFGPARHRHHCRHCGRSFCARLLLTR